MNRLKFRIWDKHYKVWLENDASLHCFSNWSICPFTGKLTDYVGAISGDIETYSASPAPDYYTTADGIVKESPYVIQQYTGLKDKNGNEIYEGDIVECNDGVGGRMHGEVVYDSEYAAFRIVFTDILQWTFYKVENAEIIGNIFETPKLLK